MSSHCLNLVLLHRRASVAPRYVAIVVCLAFASVALADDQDRYFESQIRPLLIKHCEACHGEKKQEGSLRLNSKEGWTQGGDRGPTIIPGKPEQSLLIQAIRHSDPDLKMPPGKRLAATEIQTLVKWIQQGAHDPRSVRPQASEQMSLAEARKFWSFQPVERPPVPTTSDRPLATPIDAFVARQWKRHSVSPVAPADKLTLLRRATFDLTGLPPTPAEIEAFIGDPSERAFEKVITRLLASPAYGERWGRHWLDVARYADTAGDGADYPVREAVKYRDWVIAAFNADQPYDQFIREQIAGDILARQRWESKPGNTDTDEYARQVLATGFLAIGKRYGYKPSPDYQHLDFADVIDSVGRSLLGLSLGCARCHDHKYDPISAKDYYALYGIFSSTQWAFPGGEEHKRPAHLAPLVPPSEVTRSTKVHEQKLAELQTLLAKHRHELQQRTPGWRAGGRDLDFESQSHAKRPVAPWVCSGPIEITTEAQSPFEHVHPQGKLGVRIGSGQPTDGLRYVFEPGLRAQPGALMQFSIDFRTLPGDQKGAFRFYLGRGVVQSIAIECSATATEFAIRSGKEWQVIRQLKPGSWYTLRLTLDPERKSFSGIVGKPGDLTEFKDRQLGPGWDGVLDCFICDAFGHVAGPACRRDLDNIGLQVQPFLAPGKRVAQPATPISKNAKQELATLKSTIERLTQQHKVLSSTPPYEMAYGVSEGKPANAAIQLRGEPARKGEVVPRRFLTVLGGQHVKDQGSGRLQLADWLTDPANPLTARVYVNRVWQWHFGQGLVTTPSDFGARGAPPSHPQLLDWLTSEFIAAGWSTKFLHQIIMRSRVYQLSSDDQQANLQKDPQNTWLWRYARRRLDAESLRDGMLFVSGRLKRTQPQPHPFPSVDTWGYTIHHPFHAVYPSDHRTVYLMSQRNRRHPYLALFDGADPNLSVAQRHPTTTPTQTLFLMNSAFVHEQSTGFAERILRAGSDSTSRIRYAFLAAHGRPPSAASSEAAQRFIESYIERSHDKNADEMSAWKAFARVILTSNAFLYLD